MKRFRLRPRFAVGAFLLAPLTMVVFDSMGAPPAPDAGRGASPDRTRTIDFGLVFDKAVDRGRLSVAHGVLKSIATANGQTEGAEFKQTERIEVSIGEAHLGVGAFATRVSVAAQGRAFTFFLRDLTSGKQPMVIPDLDAAVVLVDDARSYQEVREAIARRGLKAQWQQIESEPEESYESALRGTRDQICPTWLGLSRDVRLFRVSYDQKVGTLGRIEPALLARTRGPGCEFRVGRGASPEIDIVRRLEEGTLPILHATQRDGTIEYQMTAFATPEKTTLSPRSARGTHWLAAFANAAGGMITPQETQKYERELKATEIVTPADEVVCRVRVRAVNTDTVPRYAYFKAGRANASAFDPNTGEAIVAVDKALCVSRIDGQPMPQSEMAILLQPRAAVVFELIVPHQPISRQRMAELAKQDYDQHLAACRRFWLDKLATAAQISLPEIGIQERVRAGLLHLDLITLGLQAEGPLLANVGVYAPIGSESAPIIQYYDSVGWHDIAERCLDYFFLRQREDGFIQTYGGYQLETGPVLWTAGEHFRYTRDEAWARRIRPNVEKACDYLLAWRKRNQREELRGKGYGLLDGKVADPPDFFHSFMLNGVSHLGLKRASEMYASIDPAFSRRLATECEAYLQDIRTAYLENVARSPVAPLGDGAWAPSFGPWAESPGPVSLFAEGGEWYTHGVFAGRDSLIGALYLLPGEILDPRERAADWLLHVHQELMTARNAGMSQPYYARHDWAHLKRGEVKAFLKTYYTQLASLQDRQTYTFWEHLYEVSQHKTHEEAWFLMQSRWMLWDEDWSSRTLRLLSMIPRRWLESGQRIALKNCVSYFGPFDLEVHSEPAEIRATVTCRGPRAPRAVQLRLPHPKASRPMHLQGGQYDAATETLTIEPFTGSAQVVLKF